MTVTSAVAVTMVATWTLAWTLVVALNMILATAMAMAMTMAVADSVTALVISAPSVLMRRMMLARDEQVGIHESWIKQNWFRRFLIDDLRYDRRGLMLYDDSKPSKWESVMIQSRRKFISSY